MCGVQKCVTALDKAWHPEHFHCMMCGLQLGDETGFHEHDGQPYCEYVMHGLITLTIIHGCLCLERQCISG